MIRKTLWIGFYGFLEAVRNRLLLGMLVFILPLMLTTWLLNVFNLGFQAKLIKDLGLSLLSGFGLLIVIVLSLEQIFPDIEKRSIYFILTRVPSRNAFIFGRFLGVSMALAFFHFVTAFCLLLLLRLQTSTWFWEIALGSFVILLKQCVLLSFVLFLSSFASKIIVISLGALFFVLGHCFDLARMIFEKKGSFMLTLLTEVAAFFLPDFSLYELRLRVVHEMPIQAEAVGLLFCYSVVVFYLALGGRILRKRDL